MTAAGRGRSAIVDAVLKFGNQRLRLGVGQARDVEGAAGVALAAQAFECGRPHDESLFSITGDRDWPMGGRRQLVARSVRELGCRNLLNVCLPFLTTVRFLLTIYNLGLPRSEFVRSACRSPLLW